MKLIAPAEYLDYQDSPTVRAYLTTVGEAYEMAFPGHQVTITQSAPIKETMAGKMGCTWALTDSRYPNGGSFPLSPNPDVRPDSAVIASTLYSQDYITTYLAINPNMTESDLRAKMAEGNFPFGYMPPKPVS